MSFRSFFWLLVIFIPLGLGLSYLSFKVFFEDAGKIISYKPGSTDLYFNPLGKDYELKHGRILQHIPKGATPHVITSDRIRFTVIGKADIYCEVQDKEQVLFAVDNGEVVATNGKYSMVLRNQQSVLATMDRLKPLNCKYSAKDSLLNCPPFVGRFN